MSFLLFDFDYFWQNMMFLNTSLHGKKITAFFNISQYGWITKIKADTQNWKTAHVDVFSETTGSKMYS